MGLESVKEEILKSAKSEASALVAEAKKESGKIAKEASDKADTLVKESEASTKKEIENLRRQELASAELENKKYILDTKKQIMEKVFEDARKKLDKLSAEKREKNITNLLKKAAGEIDADVIYCNSKDAQFVKDFNVENKEMLGGLIAENKARTIRVDYSYETLLESVKDMEMQQINKILFG